MSHYGTHPEYCKGYDDGADETAALYDNLVAAANGLLEQWGEGNLSQAVQALDEAMHQLKHRRHELSEDAYPPCENCGSSEPVKCIEMEDDTTEFWCEECRGEYELDEEDEDA